MAVMASMAFIEFLRVKPWGWGRKVVAGLTLVGAFVTVTDNGPASPL